MSKSPKKYRFSDRLFRHLDKMASGTLYLTTPDGKERVFGGVVPGTTATLQIHHWSVILHMLNHGDVGLAQDYREGLWDTDDLSALCTLALENRQALDRLVSGTVLSRLMNSLGYFLKLNTLRGSRRNIHAHYDLGNAFYSLWLDPSMTYSSAVFDGQNISLQQAQHQKYDQILELLGHDSGSLLEVGCGWGGFAERACQSGDYAIKGITLSQQQHDFASQRLGNLAKIALEDYRHQQGRYQGIVSIEMFEAVGERYWPVYFKKLHELLQRGGKAVIQTITINDREFSSYRRGIDFIRSFIFPGGLLPSPARFREEVSRAGLVCEQPRFFGKDYALTLQHWLENFDQQQDAIRQLGFDNGFIRLWRLYLCACIAGFKTERTNVMQIGLCHA